MVTIIYETDIKAPAEKIWQILWNDGTYRKWANCFSEGSTTNPTGRLAAKRFF